ncbi:MAG: ABC transporter ATP-binding protein, partial [Planctomycetota bacterium]
MMKPELSIHAEGIGKQYRIGAKQKSYGSLRESLMNLSSSAFGKVRGGLKSFGGQSGTDTFWALKDISFEIKQGDVVGIVGSNGAGKSTLLKVLSRITDPTTGFVDLRGRVGSLLEVGTGFHPELTGRENIFLNGAILGMPRTVVKRQFDAIVDFAGVEKFIDTPVKRYSSGMYLRLAFAVAAHLEPEILLVDEVLAVGDASFQKKCIGKMDSVARDGRTVLFVSHNMAAIRSLCTRGLLLRNGQLVEQGDVQNVIECYFRDLGVLGSDSDDEVEPNRRSVLGRVELNGGGTNSVDQSESLKFSTTMRIPRTVGGFRILGLLSDMNRQQLMGLNKTTEELGIGELDAGEYRISLELPPIWLSPGMYNFRFKLYLDGEGESAKHFSDPFPLDVFGTSSPVSAVMNPASTWNFESCSDQGEASWKLDRSTSAS